jgi:CRP-like cAMP-binding protein
MPSSTDELDPRANAHLRSLPPAELALLAARWEPVSSPLGEQLHRPGDHLQHVYFPVSGMVSLVERDSDGTMVEAGTVGAEGMVGISTFLGEPEVAIEAITQIPMTGFRVPVQDFGEIVSQSPALERHMRRYALAVMLSMSRTTACNRLHTLEQRAARWLLETRDHVGGERFPLTQEFFASMLGAHRPSVTLAAQRLKEAGLIHYERGLITITDEAGLKRTACECYAATSTIYRAFRKAIEDGH